jgi:hypothetical protein
MTMNASTASRTDLRHASTGAAAALVHVIPEGHRNELRFNVMPGKEVRETLTIERYEIEGDRIRAWFDREYHSTMEKSPSHLIFLTSLVHMQKMLYALLCHKLGLPYEPEGRELMKIWPYEFHIDLPRLIVAERGLVQDLHLREWRARSGTRFDALIEASIDDSARYRIKTAVFLNV